MRSNWPSTGRGSWSTTWVPPCTVKAAAATPMSTVQLIVDRGGEAVADYGDVADHEQAGAMVERAIDEWGRLDILVNNAGIVRDGAIWNLDADDFDAVIRVHLRGTWCCSHHAARHWRDQREVRRGSDRPRHQHHLWRGAHRQLRADRVCRRQGRDRRTDPHAGPGAQCVRGHRQRCRSGRRNQDHRDDAIGSPGCGA